MCRMVFSLICQHTYPSWLWHISRRASHSSSFGFTDTRRKRRKNPLRPRLQPMFQPSMNIFQRFSRFWSAPMLSLCMPIPVTIQARMREWHPKYAAATSISCLRRLPIAYKNTLPTQNRAENGNIRRHVRCLSFRSQWELCLESWQVRCYLYLLWWSKAILVNS